MKWLPGLLGFLLLLSCGSTNAPKSDLHTDPLEPEAALASFEMVDGFRLELFAAEPDVVDPVEIAFDENGAAWVAEMRDYPYDPESGEPPKSRIRRLEDVDGDGQVDSSVVFADELKQVSSMLPWKGGVFATAAPDILYLKDSDGDGAADVREVVYTGFDDKVSPEGRVAGLRFGIDNWIYASNQGRPGSIRSPKYPEQPEIPVRGFDFRFHPVSGAFTPAGGPTQYGMSFNERGDRFVSQNTVHLRHVVLRAVDVMRNPFYSPPSMLHVPFEGDPSASPIHTLTQPQQWRVARTELRKQRGRPNELVGGYFTAATGATVYVGDALGAELRGDVFVADANGGIVRREKLTPEGATYRSEPIPADREFLASPDPWFRPVNFANAPDGNLYLADFYREYIEEPASIPEAIQEELQLDFYRGADRGRIWRIRTADGEGPGLHAGLGALSSERLVGALAHPNGWHRRTSRRLLLERQDAAAIEPLRRLFTEDASPDARLNALWALEGLGALQAENVRTALADPDSVVRAHAVRISRGFLPELAAAAAALSKDSDAKVRFEVALALGDIPGSSRAFTAMAEAEADDRWFRAALLSSVGSRPLSALNGLLRRHRGFFNEEGDPEARREFVGELAALIGARRQSDEISIVLQAASDSPRLRPAPWRAAVLDGLTKGLSYDGGRGLRVPGAEALFSTFLSSEDAEVSAAALEASSFFTLPAMTRDALRAAGTNELEVERRARAILFLRAGRFDDTAPTLEQIVTSAAPQPVRRAAVETLATFSEPRAAEILLAGWSGYDAEARAIAAEAVLSRPEGAAGFIAGLEAGAVDPRSLDAASRIRLVELPDEELRGRARKALELGDVERAQVVDQHLDALSLEGDAERGVKVFEEHCGSCHLSREGRGRVGPNLVGVRNHGPEELIGAILDPSGDIASGYTNYLVIEKDGRVRDGILLAETAATVTLRGERSDLTLLRSNIAEMRVSSVSLMPDGLEQDLSRQDLADIITFLLSTL